MIVRQRTFSREGFLSKLLSILVLAALASAAQAAADKVPRLDASLSCRSAGASSLMAGPESGTRNAAACEQDERDARNKLEQDWTNYPVSERERCTRISTLGGSPSYVELLTCLEMAKAAKQLPPVDRMGDGSLGKR